MTLSADFLAHLAQHVWESTAMEPSWDTQFSYTLMQSSLLNAEEPPLSPVHA